MTTVLAEPVADEDFGNDTPAYRYWQKRILISTIVGYALYYFVRKNLCVAMPVME
jgi:sugar phosphate permease